MTSCDICGSTENVLIDHTERHFGKEWTANICMACHVGLHRSKRFELLDPNYRAKLRKKHQEELAEWHTNHIVRVMNDAVHDVPEKIQALAVGAIIEYVKNNWPDIYDKYRGAKK